MTDADSSYAALLDTSDSRAAVAPVDGSVRAAPSEGGSAPSDTTAKAAGGPFPRDAPVLLDAFSGNPSGAPLAEGFGPRCKDACGRSKHVVLSARITRGVIANFIGWALLSALLALSGLMAGSDIGSSGDASAHTQMRGVLYFTSLCIACKLVGRILDSGLFMIIESLARLTRTGAVTYFYVSAFNGLLADLVWLIVALSTYDFILKPGALVNLDIAFRLLVLITAIAVAACCKTLVYKLLLTEVIMTAHKERVVAALEGKFAARVLSAPQAWQSIRMQQEERARSLSFAVLQADDLRAQVSCLANGDFRMYDAAGSLTPVTSELAARQAALQAFNRLASKGAADAGAAAPLSVVWGAAAGAATGGAGAGSVPGGPAGGLQPTLSFQDFQIAFGQSSGGSAETDALTTTFALNAFTAADGNGDGSVSAAGFVEYVAAQYRAWAAAKKTLASTTSSHGVLERLLSAAFWTLSFFFTLTVFDVTLSSVLLPLGTLLIAASFAIGGTASALVQSLVFTLVQRPFEIDDVVSVSVASNPNPAAAPSMRVASFDVLTTTFTLPDGRALTIPNNQLATMSISNVRYSGAATITMAVRVAFDTPAERIDALQRALAAFTATRPLLWRAPATLSVSDVVPGSHVELILGAEPVHGWQRSARLAAARGELLTVLLQSLRENAITCTEAVKPVIVLEDGAKSLAAVLARAK